jgi:1-aminocyclopropane-1-carboxylate deaminase/D-cysteine desulfhydrase-like pyridoxal-dependent ACC family enzyme
MLPPWIGSLPRFPLFAGPSPMEPLPRFSAAIGRAADVWIKREDLLPLAFGGNKLRNLEFLVGAALAEGADSLVTSGRRWSNHARLTAAAGAKAGLRVHLVLTGPPTSVPGPNQRLDALLGATIHVTRTAEREERDALVERVAAELRSGGSKPYVIPGGGGGAIGAAGQVVAAIEAVGQARASGGDFDTIVLPSATGGTQAGLLMGHRLEGSAARIFGVAPAHPAARLRPAIEAMLDELSRLLENPMDASEIEIDESELGDGYGVPTAAADEATRLLARTEGIFVDPIYTAKPLAALVRLARSDRLRGRVLFWHSGGTPGLFETLDG